MDKQPKGMNDDDDDDNVHFIVSMHFWLDLFHVISSVRKKLSVFQVLSDDDDDESISGSISSISSPLELFSPKTRL